MRILIVEDMDERYEVFDQVFQGHEVIKAYTAKEGIRWLNALEFDLVMLDHDLQEEHYANYHEKLEASEYGLGTGQEVAHAIALRETKPRVVVHSWNPVGADRICEILDDADVDWHRVWFSTTIGKEMKSLGLL